MGIYSTVCKSVFGCKVTEACVCELNPIVIDHYIRDPYLANIFQFTNYISAGKRIEKGYFCGVWCYISVWLQGKK